MSHRYVSLILSWNITCSHSKSLFKTQYFLSNMITFVAKHEFSAINGKQRTFVKNLIQGRCKISANWVFLLRLAFEPQSNIKVYISTPRFGWFLSTATTRWKRREPQRLKYQAFVIYTHPLLRKKDVYITKPFGCFIEQHIVCFFWQWWGL